MTTSLALAVRGEWRSSVEAQPFGLLLFVGGLALAMMALASLWRRIYLIDLIRSRPGIIFVYTLTILFILSWCYKIASMNLNLFH